MSLLVVWLFFNVVETDGFYFGLVLDQLGRLWVRVFFSEIALALNCTLSLCMRIVIELDWIG